MSFPPSKLSENIPTPTRKNHCFPPLTRQKIKMGRFSQKRAIESYYYANQNLFSLVTRMRKILEQKDLEIENDLRTLEGKIREVSKLRDYLQKAKALDYNALVALADEDLGMHETTDKRASSKRERR
jgi:hypothetical protein